MPARAIWKGVLKFSGESIPVKLYSAIEDHSVRFHVLEKSTLTRVKQRMVNAKTGKEVPPEEFRKGYKIENGVYVLLTDEELSSIVPAASRDIEIRHFLPANRIDDFRYDRAYFLGPDQSESAPYFSLAEALAKEKKVGVAHWVMRKKRYVGTLRSQDGFLQLITLKSAEEVLSVHQLPRPHGRAPSAKELKMAEQLISAMQGEFQPENFRDDYRDRVMKLIEAKAHGKKPKLRFVAQKKAPKSLISNLAASIDMARRHKEKAVA